MNNRTYENFGSGEQFYNLSGKDKLQTRNLRQFVQGVNFEIIDSSKNNGMKYLLFFDDSCEGFCHSKTFVDIATAGRHRGLSTIHIKHNLFH